MSKMATRNRCNRLQCGERHSSYMTCKHHIKKIIINYLTSKYIFLLTKYEFETHNINYNVFNARKYKYEINLTECMKIRNNWSVQIVPIDN